ncbi:MAG: Rrf2 family transcriptional regulator, partial [Planctomycetota bacterium]
MISQSAEYALRAVLWLAGHPEATLSTAEIARRTMVPGGYLSKVLQALARAGLVVS